ncbi:helix-turn-helix domain-containing protein [Vibrio aestuarianus]|uniref:AraC family transcriptional regulator n=1 Tax=Vibrio aestuarianus TaxID=28171 RepID=A0ABD7YQJ0_9VIBR|nr:AraC family transcriptional regulator [Vibrio aestuarianus]WGK87121.1 AraC family transcriptional regulator [Vibrio aestuarianus]CAH8236825.1 putative AraC-type DNA-binding domain-containing protein [Vibrio aestuarianus]
MFQTNKNLCKSVIRDAAQLPRKWKDDVFLAPECQERFLVLSDIPEMKQFDIFMAGLAKLNNGYGVERVSPEVHTVLITLDGGGVLHTPESIVEISVNTITFLPAGKPFRFELNDQSKSWDMVWILLNDVERWTNMRKSFRSVLNFDAAESVWSLVSLIYNEIGGRAAFRKMMLSELVKILSNVEIDVSDTQMRVLSMLNTIESQLHLDWNVADIAASVFLSTEQLNRVVKQIVGMTPRDYLIHLRMSKAADLLGNKDWSVKMIALRLGYQDPNNFTHRFRKFYGMSPRRYRLRFES